MQRGYASGRGQTQVQAHAVEWGDGQNHAFVKLFPQAEQQLPPPLHYVGARSEQPLQFMPQQRAGLVDLFPQDRQQIPPPLSVMTNGGWQDGRLSDTRVLVPGSRPDPRALAAAQAATTANSIQAWQHLATSAPGALPTSFPLAYREDANLLGWSLAPSGVIVSNIMSADGGRGSAVMSPWRISCSPVSRRRHSRSPSAAAPSSSTPVPARSGRGS